MLFFIPLWVALILLVLRAFWWAVRLIANAVLLVIWVTGAGLAACFQALCRDREPDWARKTLRGIRDLPETELRVRA